MPIDVKIKGFWRRNSAAKLFFIPLIAHLVWIGCDISWYILFHPLHHTVQGSWALWKLWGGISVHQGKGNMWTFLNKADLSQHLKKKLEMTQQLMKKEIYWQITLAKPPVFEITGNYPAAPQNYMRRQTPQPVSAGDRGNKPGLACPWRAHFDLY